jgi:hypothetical protein
MLTKVKGTDFLRDSNNMALINNNATELEAYKTRRQQMIRQKEEIDSIKEEISSVKSDISEIKQLLLKALDK